MNSPEGIGATSKWRKGENLMKGNWSNLQMEQRQNQKPEAEASATGNQRSETDFRNDSFNDTLEEDDGGRKSSAVRFL
uniref:Uncharacterized protein n=1 Tax=Cucumis melo TaxID=3656 RepID=A0A9I9CVD0_CUCME